MPPPIHSVRHDRSSRTEAATTRSGTASSPARAAIRRALFASLNCGFGSGDDKPTVAKNRAVVSDSLASASSLLTAWQWHSADAIAADEPWDVRQPPKADAIVTATPGLAIGILTADCAPFSSPIAEAGVIGAAHAGWKGALAGVTDSTIDAMEKLGARRERITAVIGPTISQKSYEVGPDFRRTFLAQKRRTMRLLQALARAEPLYVRSSWLFAAAG